MRSNIEFANILGSLLRSGNRLGVAVQTLTGTTQLGDDLPHVLVLDPGGGARTVKMPANPQIGDFYLLFNAADAAEVITVQTAAAAALVPACTPTQSECAVLVYTGSTFGWLSFVGVGA